MSTQVLRFTVPLYTHKKNTDYCILSWWHTNPGSGVCSVPELLSDCNELASVVRLPTRSCERDETEMCALFLKLATLSGNLQKTIIALKFNKLKNESHFSHSDRQTLQYIHYFSFFECDLICVTHLGVQYCWNTILEDMKSSNHYVRWSLKRAKCTVCRSSKLLRGTLAFIWHIRWWGRI